MLKGYTLIHTRARKPTDKRKDMRYKKTREKSYNCDVCNKSQPCPHSRLALILNRSTCTTTNITTTVFYKCRQCNRLFVSLTSVKQHRLTVHAAMSNPFGCGLCRKIYSIEQDAKGCFYNHEMATIV